MFLYSSKHGGSEDLKSTYMSGMTNKTDTSNNFGKVVQLEHYATRML